MTKITLLTSLLAISFAIAMPVKAQVAEENLSTTDSYSVSPRELISLARHGRFKAQGIPSHDNFRSGVRTGKITAEELVASAISNNRLPAEVIGDRNYLETVASHLKSGGCGS